MFKRFLPKEFSFFDMFDQHAELIIETAKVLNDFTKAALSQEEASIKIKHLERQADTIVHKCTEALQNTFITPIERTDILQLIKKLDDIVDSIYSAMSRIGLYEIEVLRPEARELADLILKASFQVADVLKSLRDKKDFESALVKCKLIHDLESEGDAIFRTAIKQLFKENDAVLIIKWKDVIDRLERAIDRSEEVANIIEKVIISAS